MVIDRFNEAFNRHDADALAPLLTDDTVFEDTSPAPDGRRIEGHAAVVGQSCREVGVREGVSGDLPAGRSPDDRRRSPGVNPQSTDG